MRWVSVLAQGSELHELLHQGVDGLLQGLETSPDLLMVFISGHFQTHYMQILETLMQRLDNPVLLGCSAGGLVGDGCELEGRPGLSLMGACLPGVSLQAFHLNDSGLAQVLAGLRSWPELLGVDDHLLPSLVLLPDPFSCDVDAFLHGLDNAFPSGVKLGGLASGGNRPGSHGLFLGDYCHQTGMVGLALSGNLRVDTVVAQGCRPIGEPLFVTRIAHNQILELDGQPALLRLRTLVEQLDSRDRQLARQALFLGIAMRGQRQQYLAGDFLIRNLIGIDPERGGLAVAAALQENAIVQFHVRDAQTSSEDLHALLSPLAGEPSPTGALLFSCLGRGTGLYGTANHDSQVLRQYLGPVPLGGFFCNGEIGPVHGTTFLHGYTSAFGLFRPASASTGQP